MNLTPEHPTSPGVYYWKMSADSKILYLTEVKESYDNTLQVRMLPEGGPTIPVEKLPGLWSGSLHPVAPAHTVISQDCASDLLALLNAAQNLTEIVDGRYPTVWSNPHQFRNRLNDTVQWKLLKQALAQLSTSLTDENSSALCDAQAGTALEPQLDS